MNRRAVVLLGLLVGCGGGDPIGPSPARQPRAPAARPADFAVRGARVFDGERTLPVATVVVAGGRITAVGDGAVIPPGTPIVDGAGKTLLPGLIDAHVHAFGDARRDALRFGVTAVLDMFGDPRALAEARRARASLSPTDQADLWSAGMLATARGGHGTQFGVPVTTVDAPDQAAGWVADRLAEGSDYIKIVRDDFKVYGAHRATLGDAEVAALIEAAHARGAMAVMHVSAQEAARHALSAGVDGFVHVFQDAAADSALVALARRRGAFVIPTLSVIAGIAGDAGRAAPLRDEALSVWLTAAQRQGLEARFPGMAARPALYARALESVRRLHAAGVAILAGTDAPNPSTAHGASMHDELERLVAAGLTPEQALAAATSAPARAFRLGDRGRVAPGMRADLVLVDGDPTRDIRATRAIAGIWKNGRPVARARPPAPAP